MNARILVLMVIALSACSTDSGGAGGGSSGGGNGGTGGGAGAGGGTAGSGGGTAGGSGTGGGSASSNTGTYPDGPLGGNGRYPQLVIDGAGVSHYLYGYIGLEGSTGKVPLRYGECSADCRSAGSWKFVSLGDLGLFGSDAKLALNAQGKPRLVWAQSLTSSDPYKLFFASCDANCTELSGWTLGAFRTLASGELVNGRVGRNLAVDGSGRLHFIYFTSQMHYSSCASNCATAGSWSDLTLGNFFAAASLAVTSTGQVRIAYATTGVGAVLVYRTCESSCDTPASWAPELVLYYSNGGPVALRLDSQGRPRVLFNQSNASQPTGDNTTFYAWCDSSCGNVASWTNVNPGFKVGDGASGLDFDVHSSGAVGVAYQAADTSLSLFTCLSGCESATATWSLTVGETSTSMANELKPPLPSCTGAAPMATRYPGEQVQAAFHPTTGDLETAHRAYTLRQCGSGNIVEGVSVPRFSSF